MPIALHMPRCMPVAHADADSCLWMSLFLSVMPTPMPNPYIPVSVTYI